MATGYFAFLSLTFCFLCFVLSFCFSFLSLSHFSSHPLFIFSFLFFHFLLSFSLSHFFLFFFSPHPISLCTFSFSLFFGALYVWDKNEEISSSPSLSQICGSPFFLIFFLLLPNSFYDIITTWLNMSHGIISPMWLNVSHSFMPSVIHLNCHVASSNLAMCHPIPHASKNVESRPPRNSTKFDVVAKFRETISTEKSISSSEI